MADIKFEWDTAKNTRNIVKHGIDFLRALKIFQHSRVERIDDRQDYGELRIVALGLAGMDVLQVIYTQPDVKVVRIISARKAARHERELYYREIHP